MKRIWTLIWSVVLILAALPALAEGEVHITADRFVIEENLNQATFSSNVVVIQGETTINADIVKVIYGAGGASDIKKLIATDHLVITTPTQHVTGQSGEYDPKTRIMVVTGNVVSENESGRVMGSKMRVNFAANTTEFDTGNGERVTGVFSP